MQKVSLRKLSILGLVLMAASAVTAAMVPGKTDKKAINMAPGSITDTSSINGGGAVSSVTCAPDSNVGFSQTSCNASTGAGSVTTGGPGGGDESSNDAISSAAQDGGTGANNTSTTADEA